MAEPLRIYIVSEIVLEEGRFPPGVDADTICKKHDEQIDGTLIPFLGIKARKGAKRGKRSKLHVHDSTYERSCQECMAIGQDEENRHNV